MYISNFLKEPAKAVSNKQFAISEFGLVLKQITDQEQNPFLADSYSILWIFRGSGEIRIDMEKFKVEDDAIYYLKPGRALTLDINEDAKGYLISFSREFLELYEKKTTELINTSFFNYSMNLPVIKIDAEMRSFMMAIANEMLQEFQNYFELRLEILKGLLKIFMIYLSRQFENDASNSSASRNWDLANIFYSQLEKHFVTKKMVKDYADMLAVTPGYLNEIVKDASGYSASYHIKQRIILEAKRRTIFEGDSMKEIAYYLGFFDPAHFSKYFKNWSGVNFTDFKKGVSNYC